MQTFTMRTLLLTSLTIASAIDNGKGYLPPMGWRSWNLFGEETFPAALSQEFPPTRRTVPATLHNNVWD